MKSQNEAEQWFHKIKERIDYKIEKNTIQIRTEVIVTDTSVAGAIIRYAEEHNVDLIVVGIEEGQLSQNYYLEVLLLRL